MLPGIDRTRLQCCDRSHVETDDWTGLDRSVGLVKSSDSGRLQACSVYLRTKTYTVRLVDLEYVTRGLALELGLLV